jgi:hypothetical protein
VGQLGCTSFGNALLRAPCGNWLQGGVVRGALAASCRRKSFGQNRVVLVSFAALPRRLAQPLLLGHMFVFVAAPVVGFA